MQLNHIVTEFNITKLICGIFKHKYDYEFCCDILLFNTLCISQFKRTVSTIY